MITDRLYEPSDEVTLAISLAKDEHHQGTDTDFFTQPGTVTKVYEDEFGPILFARGTKALRLDLQFIDNNDRKRNMKAMLQGFPAFVDRARENGFTEIIFTTNNEMLRAFCIKRFGFVDSPGELRKFL